MDRRMVEGLIVVLLATLGREASAQVPNGRDPSSQPPVGMVPLRSINDSINNTDLSTNPNAVPVASSRAPTSPVNSGPAAAIPNPPVLGEPVSMTPIDPLKHSLSHGFGSGRIASLFRKQGERPVAPASATTPTRFLPSYQPMFGQPTARPLTPAPGDPQASVASPRPAPYASQVPESARLQADPGVSPTSVGGEGRPSPYARQIPADARSQQAPPGVEPPTARPRIESANPPPPTTPAEPRLPALPPEPPPVVPMPAVELPPPGSIPTAHESPQAVPAVGVIELPAALPPLEATPQPMPAVAAIEMPVQPVITPTSAEVPVSPAPMIVDERVQRTSSDAEALKIKDQRREKEDNFITFRAASVGDEIITINELMEAVKLQLADDPMMAELKSEPALYQMRMNMNAARTLNGLIDQRLILQEARAKMSRVPKLEQSITEFIDNLWKTDELPALNNKYHTSNVHELRAKLKEEGKNYDAMKDAFRKKEMAHQFLNEQIHNKVTADMWERRIYYDNHKSQFDKPARMTWREIEVNVARNHNRATAKRKADELLARLLHNESFETLARKFSDGPTAAQGGLYVDTTPGSYGIASVNDELTRIPIGQVSQVIEAPNSFHIIKVESRREKGPLRFDEVQDEVKNLVLMENYEKAVTIYLAKLRSKTVVWSKFENTDQGLVATGGSSPAILPVQKVDPAVQPASINR